MINAYKPLDNGVMKMRFTEKVWAMFPPHKHGWIQVDDSVKEIPSEIVAFMESVSIPEYIVEFNEVKDADKIESNAASQGSDAGGVAKVSGNRNRSQVRGRPKKRK